ncbi:MAG: glycosyltransferase [Acidimicrobiia bacterium]|nr:glycosyltransferase [Acidimicrobiia bacterium]
MVRRTGIDGIDGIDGPFVLAVGTIEPRKGFDVAAAAVGSLPGADAPTLVIAGPPGWGRVEGLDRSRVRRLGAVTRDALDALYRHALLTVVPSTYEGFGFPALEAMARGCPVVASNTTSLPEVVGDAGSFSSPATSRRGATPSPNC